MSTSKYNQLKPKSKIKQPSGQKLSNKVAQKYTGTKSTSELRSALCVDSHASYDIFNR